MEDLMHSKTKEVKAENTEVFKGNKRHPWLKVEAGFLILNDEHKFPIDSGMVTVPDGLMDELSVDRIPEGLTLRFHWHEDSRYPMLGLHSIDLVRSRSGNLTVRLSCEYQQEDWTDPLGFEVWKAIMAASASIEADMGKDVFEISDDSHEDSMVFTVTKDGVGKTVGDVLVDEAIPCIIGIQKRARAFHFVVAEEKEKYGYM